MNQSKTSSYQLMNKQLAGLLSGETDWITNLSQFSAFVNGQLEDLNWVGFYLTQPNTDLLLGPFQGNVACTRITLGKGVCGTAALNRKSVVVQDVHQFDGHIACDSRSQSEVVCPLIVNDILIGVLDLDSPSIGRFDEDDAQGLTLLLDTLIKATDFTTR